MSFQSFGTENLLPPHILIFSLALLTITLAYLWLCIHFSRPTAVLITILIALNWNFYRYSFHILTDTPFALGFTLFLFSWELFTRAQSIKRKVCITALTFASLAIMASFRTVVLDVIAAIAILVVWRIIKGPNRKPAAILATIGIMAFISFRLFWIGNLTELHPDEKLFLKNWSQSIPQTLDRLTSQNLPRLVGEAIPEATIGLDLKLWGIPLSLLVIYSCLLLAKSQPLWAILFSVFLLQMLAFIITTRYLIPLTPFLAIAWVNVLFYVNRKLPPGHAGRVMASLLFIYLAANGTRIASTIIEQHRTPFLQHYEKGHYHKIEAFARTLNQLTKPGDLIIADTRDREVIACLANRKIEPVDLYNPIQWKTTPASRTAFYIGPLTEKMIQTADKARLKLLPTRIDMTRKSKRSPGWTLIPIKKDATPPNTSHPN